MVTAKFCGHVFKENDKHSFFSELVEERDTFRFQLHELYWTKVKFML